VDPVTNLLAAYNAHDTGAVAACYKPDGQHEDVATGHPKRGPIAIREGLELFLRAFPDAHWTVAGHLCDDTRSVAWYTLVASLLADFGPFEARGQQVTLRGVLVVAHDNQLIVKSSDYWDLATFRRQVMATRL
jgi:steroid delta-isomerase-like uncharacterized protein